MLGPRASRGFFRRHDFLAVSEKLDGYNVAVLFERPWALRLLHRRLDLHQLYAAWVPPALIWVESQLGPLYRVLGQEWVLCGEWVDPHSSLEHPPASRFFAFDLYHRPTRRFSGVIARQRVCDALQIEATPLLHQGPLGSLEEALGMLTHSRWSRGQAEGLVFSAEEDGLVRRRVKFVRPDFVRRPMPRFRHWNGP